MNSYGESVKVSCVRGCKSERVCEKRQSESFKVNQGLDRKKATMTKIILNKKKQPVLMCSN